MTTSESARSAIVHLTRLDCYIAAGCMDDHLDSLLNAGQLFRDALATNRIDVNEIIMYTCNIANAIYTLAESPRTDQHLLVCRRFVQVLANSSVVMNKLNHNHQNIESPIWAHLKSKPEFWVRVLSHDDAKLRTYSSMLLYNCVHYCNGSLSELIDQSTVYNSVILSVVGSLKLESPPEWNVYLLEKLLSHANLVGAYKNTLTPGHMHALLDVIDHVLDKNERICEDNFICISSMFCDMYMLLGDIGSSIFNAPGSETWQILRKCLCVLSKCASCVQYSNVRNSKTLFISATQFLTEIVTLGKKEHVLFRPKLDLESFRKLFHNETEGLCPSIVYGLKQDLVRLLGNMTNANECLQGLVEQYHVLALLLDCTVSESENPLLSQWSVLAIRHLCHFECNRRIIAGLQPHSHLQSPIPEIDQLLKSLNINNG